MPATTRLGFDLTPHDLWASLPQILRMSPAEKIALCDAIQALIDQAEKIVPESECYFVARPLKVWWDVISRLALSNDYNAREAITLIIPTATSNS